MVLHKVHAVIPSQNRQNQQIAVVFHQQRVKVVLKSVIFDCKLLILSMIWENRPLQEGWKILLLL